MESIALTDRDPRSKSLEAGGGGPDSDTMASTSSSTSHTVQLTPEEDSLDSDIELHHRNPRSFEMEERDPEKAHTGLLENEGDHEDEEDEDEEDDHYLGSRRRGSVSTTQSFQLYTPDEERAVVRKFDRHLVLFVALLYMLSFLDRSSTYHTIRANHHYPLFPYHPLTISRIQT